MKTRTNPSSSRMSPIRLFEDSDDSSKQSPETTTQPEELSDDNTPLSEMSKKRKGKEIAKPEKKAKIQRAPQPKLLIQVSRAEFISDDSFAFFKSCLASREVQLGKRYLLDTLPTLGLHEILNRYMPLIALTEPAYPLALRLFYANLKIDKASGDITSSVRGQFIRLNEKKLRDILGLSRCGTREFCWTPSWDRELSVTFHDAKAKILENQPVLPSISYSKLPTLSRFLLHIVQYNLSTNFTRTDHLTSLEILIIFHLLNGTPIDPAFLIMCMIKKFSTALPSTKARIPLSHIFTPIFHAFDVDLSLDRTSIPIKPYGSESFGTWCHWKFDPINSQFLNDKNQACKYQDGKPLPPIPINTNQPDPTGPSQTAPPTEQFAGPSTGPSVRPSAGPSSAPPEPYLVSLPELHELNDKVTSLEKEVSSIKENLFTISSLVETGFTALKEQLSTMSESFKSTIKEMDISRETEYEEFTGRLQTINQLLDDQHRASQKGVAEVASNLEKLELTEGKSFSSLISILRTMIRVYKMDRVHLNPPPSHPNVTPLSSSPSSPFSSSSSSRRKDGPPTGSHKYRSQFH